EHVEVAQAHVLQSIHAAKLLRVEFADVFCNAVWRNRFRLHGFNFWQSRSFTVGRGGSSEYNPFYLGVAGSEQEIQRAFDIDAIGLQGIFDGARNRSASGKMNHVIGFVHRAANRFDVVDGALDEGNLVARFAKIVFFAGGKIVKDNHAFTAADECVHRVGSDEAGATGNHVSHSSHPPNGSASEPGPTPREKRPRSHQAFSR